MCIAGIVIILNRSTAIKPAGYTRAARERKRLPTEAEWERACRGVADGKMWGDRAPAAQRASHPLSAIVSKRRLMRISCKSRGARDRLLACCGKPLCYSWFA